MITFGYDTQRRPAIYLMFSSENTVETHRHVELVVWFIERSLDLAGPGVEYVHLAKLHSINILINLFSEKVLSISHQLRGQGKNSLHALL